MLKKILQGQRIRHPLHPITVHLPVGLWVASFILDLAFMISGKATFATSSYYCILIGVLGSIPSWVTGFAELTSIPKSTHPRRMAIAHMILNAGVTLLYLFNLISRHKIAQQMPRAISEGAPTLITGSQFILSVFSILLLTMSGYIGGLLIYNYGIGFKPQLREPEPGRPERRKKTIERIGRAA